MITLLLSWKYYRGISLFLPLFFVFVNRAVEGFWSPGFRSSLAAVLSCLFLASWPAVLVDRLTTVLVGCLSEPFFLSAWQPPDSTFLLTVWLAVLAAHTVNEGPVRIQYKCLVPFMYSQKWNCYFQNRIIMFCLPVPTFIHFQDRSAYSRCREICGLILGIYKSLTEMGLRPGNSQKRNT